MKNRLENLIYQEIQDGDKVEVELRAGISFVWNEGVFLVYYQRNKRSTSRDIYING